MNLKQLLSWQVEIPKRLYAVIYHYAADGGRKIVEVPERYDTIESALNYMYDDADLINKFVWVLSEVEAGFAALMSGPDEIFVPSTFISVADTRDNAVKVLDILTDHYFESDDVTFDDGDAREVAAQIEAIL